MDYQTVEELLQKYGQGAHATPLSPEVKAHIENVATNVVFNANECYRNAQHLTVFDMSERIHYCEGFMEVEGIRIAHAWCSVDGQIFDPTLPRHINPQEPRYFGVCVPRFILIKVIKETRLHACCLEVERFWTEFIEEKSNRIT